MKGFAKVIRLRVEVLMERGFHEGHCKGLGFWV